MTHRCLFLLKLSIGLSEKECSCTLGSKTRMLKCLDVKMHPNHRTQSGPKHALRKLCTGTAPLHSLSIVDDCRVSSVLLCSVATAVNLRISSSSFAPPCLDAPRPHSNPMLAHAMCEICTSAVPVGSAV